MIITVGNQKGGCGKTTLAVNLACLYAQKGTTLLIDADTQQSSMLFREARPDTAAHFSAVANHTATIHEDVKTFTHNTIIIDAGGRDNKPFRSSVIASDLLIIPVTPSPVDLWSAEDTFRLYQEIKMIKNIKGLIVLNMVQPGVNITGDVIDILKEYSEKYQLKVLDSMISFRTAFKESFAEGLSVAEMKGEKFKKAAEETINFFNEVNHVFKG
ncbi:MAG TPA: AAA family ATPase [bacterium]|jgi:chromosome partitioning protein|nr:AAA family ATPase [bacterium]HQN73464.1 AAA family ATPase [bacterium]HRQ71060.1 AAA family ATPase [bacterium]